MSAEYIKVCQNSNCGIEFTTKWSNKIYCCINCKLAAINRKRYLKRGDDPRFHGACIQCGKDYVRTKKNRKPTYCSEECRKAAFHITIEEAVTQGKRLLDKTSGYERIYFPSHEKANTYGYVYAHRLIMEYHLNRSLLPNEVVHHKNGIRNDNNMSNLELMTNEEHIRHHGDERSKKPLVEEGASIQPLKEKRVYTKKVVRPCKVCNTPTKNIIYCGDPCRCKDARRFNPTAEELHKLIWELPTTEVAKLFGVSDKAIEKRCNILGVEKPPRGYWAKKAAGKI